MYELVGLRGSRAFRVLVMLEELGVDYDHIPAKPQSPEARAINPTGKVPALRDGDAVITDSVAIMIYLADKHNALTFAAGTPERAQQDAMTFRIMDELDGVLWAEGKQRFFVPEERKIPELTDYLKWEYERNIAGFEDVLVDMFLTGDQIRVPDILLSHCLRWAEMFKFPEPGPKLSEFKTRMENRPSFAATLAKA